MHLVRKVATLSKLTARKCSARNAEAKGITGLESLLNPPVPKTLPPLLADAFP